MPIKSHICIYRQVVCVWQIAESVLCYSDCLFALVFKQRKQIAALPTTGFLDQCASGLPMRIRQVFHRLKSFSLSQEPNFCTQAQLLSFISSRSVQSTAPRAQTKGAWLGASRDACLKCHWLWESRGKYQPHPP